MQLALILMVLLTGVITKGDASYFGAFAYSASTGAHGSAVDHPSRKAAETAALAACSEKASDCAGGVWFQNSCGSLAAGKDGGWGGDWGADPTTAEQKALTTCSQNTTECTTLNTVCTKR